MQVFKSNKQKDNFSKTFWDMGKISAVALILYPFAQKGRVDILSIILGLLAAGSFWGFAMYLDRKEI